MTDRLLILGAGAAQVPAYAVAQELGIETVGIDPDPEAPGLAIADVAYCHDLADFGACLEIARRHAVTGAMTLAADYPMEVLARVRAALDLPCQRDVSIDAVTDKAVMAEALARAGVAVARTTAVTDRSEAIAAVRWFERTCIIKPADSSGGRGVNTLDADTDEDRIATAFEQAVRFSRRGRAVVSEFVEGPEFSIESMSIAGTVEVVAVTDKLTNGSPYHVEIGHSQPSQYDPVVTVQVVQCARDAVMALGIDDGPAHTEIRQSREGPMVIEVGARVGGGYIGSHLVPLSTGVDLVRASVQSSMGAPPDLRGHPSGGHRGAAIRFLTPRPGRVLAVDHVEAARRAEGVHEVVVSVDVGDEIRPLIDGTGRCGHVIAQGDDAGTAIANAQRGLRLVTIATDEP